jgi:capsular exopolysaccharide synthesis family protein
MDWKLADGADGSASWEIRNDPTVTSGDSMSQSGTRGGTSLTPNSPNNADWLKPPEEELGLKRYVETIRERYLLVVIAVLVTTAFAVLYVLVAQKTYEAESDLLITPVASDTLPSLPLIRQSADPTRDVETAAKLVTNTDVAAAVKDQLDLSPTPQDLLKDVTAEPIAQSNIVAVTAQAHSREDARDLANAFADTAVAQQTDKLHKQIESQSAGIQAQLRAGPSPTLSARLSELQALSTGPDPTIQRETPADLPQDPSKPRPAITIAGGIFAGLAIGIAAAFLIQILDPTLRRDEQLRRRYSLPILARIPLERKNRSDPLGPRQLSAAAAEAYRTLRATLDAPDQRSNRDTNALLITGPSPSEGKTTTALNLASSLALAGRRVILIEADLRRPALANALGVGEVKAGVVSVLIENTKLEDALIPSPDYGQNLQALLADYSGGWIAEIFSIPAAQQLIDDARKIADYVIVDSPPLTEVVDALPLAYKCDQILIVTRLGKTRLDRLSRLAELLADNDIQPAGFAVVGVPRPKKGDYRYYQDEPSQDEKRLRRSLISSGRQG